MSLSVVTGWDDVVGTYVHSRLGSRWISNSGTAIGLVDQRGVLVAGVTYTLFNGSNVSMDVFAESPGWCRPEFMYCFFHYPFGQLGCERVTGLVASTNARSIRFCEKIGFELEGKMERAIPNGDILTYRMFKNKCRWIKQPAQFPKVFVNGKERA